MMKKYGVLLLIVTVGCLKVNPALSQSRSVEGFEKLKSLVGDWQGVKSDGEKVDVSYELISGGSALVETLKPVNEPNMVTVYHLNGDKLMMTHYCSAGNQPRMVADITGSGVSQINFSFVDVTNISSSSEGHMKSLKFTFSGDNLISQTWVFSREGQSMPATFQFKRKE